MSLKYFVLVMLMALPGFAQSVLTEMSVPADDINNIQAFGVGDSVFVSWAEKNRSTKSIDRRSFWIADNGRVIAMPNISGGESVICGIVGYNDETYYYSLSEVNHELVLQATVCEGRTCRLSGKRFTVAGELLGISVDRETFVLSYNKKDKSLRLVKLERLNEIDVVEIKLPYSFETVYHDCSGFISGDQFLSIAQGASRLKLYRYPSEIAITADVPHPVGKVMIVRFPLSGEPTIIKNLSVRGKGAFTSYFVDDKLYTMSHELNRPTLKCFDMKTGELVSNTVWQPGASHKQTLVYSRAGTGEVTYERSVHEMLRLANLHLPSLVIDNGSGVYDVI